MSERACDLCGWPIEAWQKARWLESATIDLMVEKDVISHANPADCRPTLKPGGSFSAGEGVAMARYEAGVNEVIEYLGGSK